MDTLEIKKEAAIAAHETASNKGKKLLEDLLGKKVFQKEVADRIKTFDDVFKELGIIPVDFAKQCDMLAPDEVAYRKVNLFVQALNEGWNPDWTNSIEYKYYPWFRMGGSSGSGFSFGDCASWTTCSYCCSRLCFKSRELALYAGKQFTELYKEYFLIKS